MTKDQIRDKAQELANYLLGTANTLAQALEVCEVPDDYQEDVEGELAWLVEECQSCGWWFEPGELVDDDGNAGYCEDCRE